MFDYKFELEKGSKKYPCPSCGAPKKFKRYVFKITGDYVGADYGRCDRENSCGYHQRPSSLSVAADSSRFYSGRASQHFASQRCESSFQNGTPDYIPFELLERTLTADYEQNTFVQFLLNLFPDDCDAVRDAVTAYRIGTFKGFSSFPNIDRAGRVAAAKLMKFNPQTGKRLKTDFAVSSLPSQLKRAGELKQDFETDKDVFFGEHLLSKFPTLPVAVVEAEKTAVIASICKGVFPDFVWLATTSKQWLKVERLRRLGDQRIILYPDADGFDLWQKIAADARGDGLDVRISALIENKANVQEKSDQVDIADYLISAQQQINQVNTFVDDYNAKVKAVLKNANLNAQFNSILEEEKSILMINSGLSEIEAENQVSEIEFVRRVVKSLWEK